MKPIEKICLLGFGEVGNVLAQDLPTGSTLKLVAWDVQFKDPDSKASVAARSCTHVEGKACGTGAVEDCELIISAVTAAQDLPAAESVLAGLKAGAWFLDLNSVSPAIKIEVAETVEAAGGCYIEAAIMSPIAPKRLAAPVLIGGPHAEKFLQQGIDLGFSGMCFFSEQLGKAAAAKMCRSVMIKGIEALLTESLLAARHYGVEDEVMASLNDLFPRPDWTEHARYMISRSIEHGVRRAEEMREAAQTVSDAGLTPTMSEACTNRQAWASHFGTALQQKELASMLDVIITELHSQSRNQKGKSA